MVKNRQKFSIFQKIIANSMLVIFFYQSLFMSPVQAQLIASQLSLPIPGQMVTASPVYVPLMLTGLRINPEDPLRFDFIIDTGNSDLNDADFSEESKRLVRYFLASLTIPDKNMWVNLSPYEQDRIIPEQFGVTEMGRDLLAQDYLLKQITSSLLYPENQLGKEFWNKVYEKAREAYGQDINIPVDTYNKVWIVPEKAKVYTKDNIVYVLESRMKVMLEDDYKAMKENDFLEGEDEKLSPVMTEILREVIIPEIEKEINEGKNFARLRQVYHSLILATWFKRNLKESFLGKVYVKQNKVNGIDLEDREIKQKIYEQYVKAFQRGVYDYIKEEYDPVTQQIIPRKYFSGGVDYAMLGSEVNSVYEATQTVPADLAAEGQLKWLSVQLKGKINNDQAMLSRRNFLKRTVMAGLGLAISGPLLAQESLFVSSGQIEEASTKANSILNDIADMGVKEFSVGGTVDQHIWKVTNELMQVLPEELRGVIHAQSADEMAKELGRLMELNLDSSPVSDKEIDEFIYEKVKSFLSLNNKDKEIFRKSFQIFNQDYPAALKLIMNTIDVIKKDDTPGALMTTYKSRTGDKNIVTYNLNAFEYGNLPGYASSFFTEMSAEDQMSLSIASVFFHEAVHCALDNGFKGPASQVFSSGYYGELLAHFARGLVLTRGEKDFKFFQAEMGKESYLWDYQDPVGIFDYFKEKGILISAETQYYLNTLYQQSLIERKSFQRALMSIDEIPEQDYQKVRDQLLKLKNLARDDMLLERSLALHVLVNLDWYEKVLDSNMDLIQNEDVFVVNEDVFGAIKRSLKDMSKWTDVKRDGNYFSIEEWEMHLSKSIQVRNPVILYDLVFAQEYYPENFIVLNYLLPELKKQVENIIEDIEKGLSLSKKDQKILLALVQVLVQVPTEESWSIQKLMAEKLRSLSASTNSEIQTQANKILRILENPNKVQAWAIHNFYKEINGVIDWRGKRSINYFKNDNGETDLMPISAEADQAMLSEDRVGGIDFDSTLLDIEASGETANFIVPLEFQGINFQDIYGFTPLILNISSMGDLPMILEMGGVAF